MSEKDPFFLSKPQVLLYHEEQLRLFGGSSGLRDDGLLESAVAAPQNVYTYEEDADIFDLAASYLSSIARNHPFIDGNKRTATEAALSFLKINGLEPDLEPIYLTVLVEKLVTRSCDESLVASFFFIACFAPIAKDLASIGFQDETPPDSFLRAESKDEKRAIIVDLITVKLRARLIEICPLYLVRPSRFDGLLDHIENGYFKTVAEKWRFQFGMNCEEE